MNTHTIHTDRWLPTQTYIHTRYENTHNTRRWMAPESLTHRSYSHKSDVYSFGMLLWEMWSSGTIPYASFSDDERVARRVLSGLRPDKPEGCPESVYKLMQTCWKAAAADRPTFAQLKMSIQDAYAAEVASQSARENENLCVWCMDKPADYAVLPCGHKCLCEADSAAIVAMNGCPVCRGPVQRCARIW
jgi:serine/threonine protein kinase